MAPQSLLCCTTTTGAALSLAVVIIGTNLLNHSFKITKLRWCLGLLVSPGRVAS